MSSRIVDLTAVRESRARLVDIKRKHPETRAPELQTIREVYDSVDEFERNHPELAGCGDDEWLDELHEDALREAENTDTETQADHAANDDSENNDAS